MHCANQLTFRILAQYSPFEGYNSYDMMQNSYGACTKEFAKSLFLSYKHSPDRIHAAIHVGSLIAAKGPGCRRHSLQPQIWPAIENPNVIQVSAYMHVRVSCLDCTITSRADLPKVFSKALRTSDMMRERLAKAKLAAAAMAAR